MSNTNSIKNTPENSERDSVESSDVLGFDEWWYTDGSGMTPLANDDMESHTRRVAKAAWLRSRLGNGDV